MKIRHYGYLFIVEVINIGAWSDQIVTVRNTALYLLNGAPRCMLVPYNTLRSVNSLKGVLFLLVQKTLYC